MRPALRRRPRRTTRADARAEIAIPRSPMGRGWKAQRARGDRRPSCGTAPSRDQAELATMSLPSSGVPRRTHVAMESAWRVSERRDNGILIWFSIHRTRRSPSSMLERSFRGPRAKGMPSVNPSIRTAVLPTGSTRRAATFRSWFSVQERIAASEPRHCRRACAASASTRSRRGSAKASASSGAEMPCAAARTRRRFCSAMFGAA